MLLWKQKWLLVNTWKCKSLISTTTEFLQLVPRWNKCINLVRDYNAKNANSVKCIHLKSQWLLEHYLFYVSCNSWHNWILSYAWTSPFCPELCQLLATARSSWWVHGLRWSLLDGQSDWYLWWPLQETTASSHLQGEWMELSHLQGHRKQSHHL